MVYSDIGMNCTDRRYVFGFETADEAVVVWGEIKSNGIIGLDAILGAMKYV